MLKTKYSDPFGLEFTDEKGAKKPVIMGCYGIGLSRLMGAIVEVHNDNKGIIWPETVAPYKAHIVEIGKDRQVKDSAAKIYQNLQNQGIEVLYDDRNDASAGEKLADADLIGIPYRLIVSEKSLEKKGVELKKRQEDKVNIMPFDKLTFILNEKK